MRTYVELVLADGSRLECRSMQGDEQLGTAAVFVVEVLSAAPLDTALVGSRASISLRGDQEERLIPGAIWKLVSIMTASAEGPRRYRIELRSGFAWLELRRRTRVYQNLSVPGIVRQVLQANGYKAGDIVERLGELHPARAYVTQYDETDAAFVRRICEDEGLYFRFEAADGRERFLLEDTSANAPRGTEDPLLVESRHGVEASQVVAYDFEDVRQRRVGRYTTRDYDPLRPALKLEGVAKVPDGQGAGRAQVFDARVAPEMTPLDDFIEALLFDSAGQPMPSDLDKMAVQFEVTLADNTKLPATDIANGYGAIPSIKGDPPSACAITFDGLDDDDFSDTVPTDAAPALPPASSLLTSRRGGPVLDVVAVTRRALAAKTSIEGVLNAANVFQLARRNAQVIEFEHFNDGSAVFLPGQAPPSVYATALSGPLGIDVLKACRVVAQDYSIDQIVITGHGRNVSQQRADCIRTLLVGDDSSRTQWVSIATSLSADQDIDAILDWASLPPPAGFGWPCATSNQARSNAVSAFQANYNGDMANSAFPEKRPAIDEDGILGPQTWGAIFDCYMRALGPPAPPPPSGPAVDPLIATLDVGLPATWTGGNANRPRYQNAFVVLGSNGPGNAPITIAKYGTRLQDKTFMPDGENHYVEMEPLNPRYRFGVDPEFVGQALNVPTAWVQNLLDAGYVVQRDPPPDPPPPVPSERAASPAPLAAPGPISAGCGAHHVTTPFASAESRRSAQRRAEVAFIEAGITPIAGCGPGDGACRASLCELFDPREFTFEYLQPHDVLLGPITFSIQLFDVYGHPIQNAPFAVDVDGTILTGSAADSIVRVRGLPPPQTCVVQWSRPDAERRASAVDPTAPLSPFEYKNTLTVIVASSSSSDGVRQRLSNLGHGYHANLRDAVTAFQRDGLLPETGLIDDIRAILAERHDRPEPFRHPRPSEASEGS